MSELFGPWKRFKITRAPAREGAEAQYIVSDAEIVNEQGMCAIVAWAQTKEEAMQKAYDTIKDGEENG